MNFLTIKPESFGIDISDCSVKIVQLKKQKNCFDLVRCGIFPVGSGIVENGEIKNQEKLSEIISQALVKMKIKNRCLITSLPERKGFLRIIKLPKMSLEQAQKAVYFEAENYIPLPIEEAYLDSRIISSPKGGQNYLEVLIVSLPKTIVDSYLSLFKKINLQPQVFEIESMSIARAIVKNQTSSNPLFLIELGRNKTNFIIFSGKTIKFTCTLPVAGRLFTEAIVKDLKIDQTEAEKIKISQGLKGKVFDALGPILTDFKKQIGQHIDYYQTHFNSKPSSAKISKILLSGGSANLIGLPEFLSGELKIPVEVSDPWINIPLSKKSPKLSASDSLKYTTALGLALRGVSNYD